MKIAVVAKVRNGTLVQWRRDNGNITAAAACRQLGLDQQTWSNIETFDFRRVSWATICKFADAIGVLPEELVPPEALKQDFRMPEIVSIKDIPNRELSFARTARHSLSGTPESAMIANEQREGLLAELQTLTHREREIIKLRYGIDGDRSLTYDEIGRIFKVTGERVRRVEAKAICKLRHPSRLKRLAGIRPTEAEIIDAASDVPALQCSPENFDALV